MLIKEKFAIFFIIILPGCDKDRDNSFDTDKISLFCGEDPRQFILLDRYRGRYYVNGAMMKISLCTGTPSCMKEPFPFTDIESTKVGQSLLVDNITFTVTEKGSSYIKFLSYQDNKNFNRKWEYEYDYNIGLVNIHSISDNQKYSICAGNLKF